MTKETHRPEFDNLRTAGIAQRCFGARRAAGTYVRQYTVKQKTWFESLGLSEYSPFSRPRFSLTSIL